MVKTLSDKEIRSLASNTFNQTWEYIEKENRSSLEDEMMSRSYAGVNDKDNSEKYYKLALEDGDQIQKAENKKMFLEDLTSGNWFGIR